MEYISVFVFRNINWKHIILLFIIFTEVCENVSHSVMSNSLWLHGLTYPPGSSVHGILQARILEWVAVPFSRVSSQHRNQTQVSCTADTFFFFYHLSLQGNPGVYLLRYQFSSVAWWYPTLCDPIDHSTPGFPVHHQLLEPTQTHVHWVGDAIQPSHPLSSPSPPVPNPSQHQGPFKWVSSSHQVVKVLEFHLQHQSFKWIFRIDFL